MKFILNGKEYELDLFDVDVMEHYETATLNSAKKMIEMGKSKDKCQKLSDVMKIGCDIIFDFFDNVFGKGTAENIFDGKRNYKLCLNTYKECNEQYKKFAIENLPEELNPIFSNLENKQKSVEQKNKQNYQNYINARNKKRQKNKIENRKKEKKEQQNVMQELENFKKTLEDSPKDVLDETLNFVKSLKEHIKQEESQNEKAI